MDSIIPFGQKNTLAKYMMLSGTDNHPPMLDKDLYDSWKSRMELYMQNKKHRRMILESVEHSLLIWPTIEENGLTRTKKYVELSATEKISNLMSQARQCRKPKRRKRCLRCSRKINLLVKAQGNGKVLNDEELEFLVNPGITEGPVIQSVITHNAAYQTDDLDVFDFDCDEISTAKDVLMANLSSYGSYVLSEYLLEAQNAPLKDINLVLHIQDVMILSMFEELSHQEKDAKHIDKEIALEKKVKELENIVKNKREAHEYYLKHTMEQAAILREVVEQAKSRNPLDSASYSACCPNSFVVFGLPECSKHIMRSLSNYAHTNFDHFLLTRKFSNDQVVKIMGYGDYQIGNVTILRVYYVKGLGHNLFLVGQLCYSDLEVAFKKHTCFVRNLEGVDLLSGSRGTNLYSLSIGDMMSSSPICLLSQSHTRTKSCYGIVRLSTLTLMLLITWPDTV
ncbi:hypothetical protein Tco_0846359 [Tanacetum coccineum]